MNYNKCKFLFSNMWQTFKYYLFCLQLQQIIQFYQPFRFSKWTIDHLEGPYLRSIETILKWWNISLGLKNNLKLHNFFKNDSNDLNFFPSTYAILAFIIKLVAQNTTLWSTINIANDCWNIQLIIQFLCAFAIRGLSSSSEVAFIADHCEVWGLGFEHNKVILNK